MFRTLLAALTFSLGLAVNTAAVAQDRPVVVELFTSQGCSSCPAADALLHQLAKDKDVIALALHVDYWDYIGWKDSFGSAVFSKRQRAYAATQGERMVYTPQMMFNGVEHVVGNRKGKVRDALKRHKALSPTVSVAAKRQGNDVVIDLAPLAGRGDYIVQLVTYRAKATVNITRGENAGRTISYANVVTKWDQVGRWNGRSSKTLKVKGAGSEPMAVLVQAKGLGEIVGSAHVR